MGDGVVEIRALTFCAAVRRAVRVVRGARVAAGRGSPRCSARGGHRDGWVAHAAWGPRGVLACERERVCVCVRGGGAQGTWTA